MIEILNRIGEHLVDRVTGPMHLRVYLQPFMALIFATISGIKDAREGNTPYFWGIFTDPENRREMLRSGWKSVGKVFIIAVVLDSAYQIIVNGFIYPGETLIVATILAILPYLIFRGLVTRVVRMFI